MRDKAPAPFSAPCDIVGYIVRDRLYCDSCVTDVCCSPYIAEDVTRDYAEKYPELQRCEECARDLLSGEGGEQIAPPRPWQASQDGAWLRDTNGKWVVDYGGCGSHAAEWAPGALEYTLCAVNAHDAFVAACEAVLEDDPKLSHNRIDCAVTPCPICQVKDALNLAKKKGP